MNGPLSGLTLVDFTKFLPGPYCTWMLGNLGADVIRVENPRELAKQAQVFGWEKLSPDARADLRARDIYARNKRSLVIDPGHEEAKSVIGALVANADILVEDYRPGVMEAMGYGPAAMLALNPRLVYASVTLCGQTGPYRDKPGHDPVALAIAGALSRIGEDADKPSFPGVPVADLLSGSNAVIGILSAIIARGVTGKGQHVDVAMSDASLALVASTISRNPDLSNVPGRGKRRADSGIWETADGRFITTTDMEPRYWQRFCTAVGRPDFAAAQMDIGRRAEIAEALAGIFRTKTLAEWLAVLGEADTQFAPIHDLPGALADPHNRARGMVFEVDLPGGGKAPHIGLPIRLSDTPPAPPQPAHIAGGDSDDILAGIGLSQSDIQALRDKGALSAGQGSRA
ncbi:CaiB/BaiF CoA transferase family protein [Niveispirillum sp. KHB5.9]|uniref:CaiB/BaiF CoA transferase family protein n=1 Tax=Niveispirillum sp. KHB5.9 TaxID=3400269 RepID=UPI003A83E92B